MSCELWSAPDPITYEKTFNLQKKWEGEIISLLDFESLVFFS